VLGKDVPDDVLLHHLALKSGDVLAALESFFAS
jgi:hypothetical protein